MLLDFRALPQNKTSSEFSEYLKKIESNLILSDQQKLQQVITLKKEFEKNHLTQDSVYAKMLHRIGALYFSLKNFNEAIDYTIQSVRINTSEIQGSSRKFATNSYYNLGLYFQTLHFFKQSLYYYDACINLANEYKDITTSFRITNARLRKGNIYYQTGDYEKDIQEMSLGLKTATLIRDTSLIVDVLNEQAQAYIALKKIDDALTNVKETLSLLNREDHKAYANNYKIRAAISEANNNYKEAIIYYKKTIESRYKTSDASGIGLDYLDAGNFLKKNEIEGYSGDFSNARKYYSKCVILSNSAKDYVTAAKASNNLALISLTTHNYPTALLEYHNSLLQTVPTFKDNNALNNPTYRQCNAISDKNFLALLLGNKTECLLFMYKQSRNKQYLTSALNTARLTDSLITDMRHEQTGEQSKLYWRDETREFFSNAIEACYQAKDGKLAYYFMEKSRAVLLNDKLNELGASAYLPPQDAEKEQAMQINVLSLQQQLSQLKETDSTYEDQQVKLLHAKEDFENYVKTLQEKYPAYYQYKYADDVPKLINLQKYLYNNKQSFVHYFITDSSVYMLSITAASVKFIKLNVKQFNAQQFQFLKICSDKQALNNHYESFASLSNTIYKTLFKPLQLPAGRVIICYDSYLIPFEALTTDSNGRDFLISNYTFSYVYSARFLLKKFKNPRGEGNFLGVAPVSYADHLHVPRLTKSETSLTQSASFFNGFKLITNSEASRNNFLKLLPNYTVVTVLSHACADSTDSEPILFMADSVIRLSELQLLRNPSTKLIVLSACQTNVGKIATGEGIISLARGFASAGIPCISATLWKADEKAIYNITDAFLKNVSEGMRKDDALQKAKLVYMQSGSNQNLLPFFWANMILAGNGEPVKFSDNNHLAALITGTVFITATLLVYIVYFKRKRFKKMLFTGRR